MTDRERDIKILQDYCKTLQKKTERNHIEKIKRTKPKLCNKTTGRNRQTVL